MENIPHTLRYFENPVPMLPPSSGEGWEITQPQLLLTVILGKVVQGLHPWFCLLQKFS